MPLRDEYNKQALQQKFLPLTRSRRAYGFILRSLGLLSDRGYFFSDLMAG